MFHQICIENTRIHHGEEVRNITSDEDLIQFLTQLLDPKIQEISFTTSGTTGAPKQLLFTKEQIAASAQRTCDFFELTEKDTALLAMPTKYVAGRMVLARAALSGMKIQLGEISLNPLKNIPLQHAITFIAITPAQASILIENEWEKLNAIKTIIIGGGEIPLKLEKELMRLKGNVYATYAMTETLSHIALRKIGEKHYFALPDVSFSVNEHDCLQVHVPYLYKEALQTKDVVQLIDHRTFIWLGRWDNVINSGGLKLYPENIERKLLMHPYLQKHRFYVSKKSDALFGNVPVLYVESASPEPTLLDDLNALLDKHERLKAIYTEAIFEETETGKIKRKTT